jgi:DNA invertase Pin-like site-specific DNA recombinase
MLTLITAEHLQRNAYIYIRQSSFAQVVNNKLSQEVQRNLKKRVMELGWPEQRIIIVDEDLGSSASVALRRKGFSKLKERICEPAGALVFLYASRLARNDEEWCHALNICAIHNVIIIDRSTIYDPASPNDRLSLGIQGIFSEYEVKQLQIRAKETIDLLASQGKLFIGVPAAYVKTEDNRLEKTPDKRIQDSITDVFARFDKLGSIQQVYKWYHDNKIELPIRDGNKIVWRIPSPKTFNKILTDNIYAGTYQYPKTKTITRYENGKIIKTRGHHVPEEEAQTLIHNHFEDYISREHYVKNQEIIANNCIMTANNSIGAPREGQSILTGLLICGHCNRKLVVRYNKKQSSVYQYYYCRNQHFFPDTKQNETITFNGIKLEHIVSEEILKVVQPYAIKAAIAAEEIYNQISDEKLTYLTNSIEQLTYEAGRIERQYNNVEPENRLVASLLERRLQNALEKKNKLETQYQKLKSEQKHMTKKEREQLFELSGKLQRVWNDPKCNYREKTRLVRLLIQGIQVTRLTPAKFKAVIHWHGGVHTTYEFFRRTPAKSRNEDRQPVIISANIIRQLVKVCRDEQIVRILNRANYRPEKCDTHFSWTKSCIEQIRHDNNIPEFSQDAYDQLGVVNLQQAASILDVSLETVTKVIKAQLIQANQVIKYAPWIIKKSDLSKPEVNRYIKSIQKGRKKSFNKAQMKFI